MQDLATPSDFAASRRRLADVTTIVVFTFRILTFAGLLLVLGVNWSSTGAEFWRSFFLAVAIGVVLGLIAAIPTYFAERKRDPSALRRKVTAILSTGAGLLPPPPSDAYARLLCAVALPERQFVGGMLYVTPAGLTFQPHFGPRSWWRPQSRAIPRSFPIGPPGSIVLSPGFFPSPRPRLARMLGLAPSQALIVGWADGEAAFAVPDAPLIIERLQPHIDALRSGSPAV